MLREIEQGIRILAWQQTKDGQRESGWRHFPQRYPLTEAERAEQITDAVAKQSAAGKQTAPLPTLEELRELMPMKRVDHVEVTA